MLLLLLLISSASTTTTKRTLWARVACILWVMRVNRAHAQADDEQLFVRSFVCFSLYLVRKLHEYGNERVFVGKNFWFNQCFSNSTSFNMSACTTRANESFLSLFVGWFVGPVSWSCKFVGKVKHAGRLIAFVCRAPSARKNSFFCL